MRSNPVLVSTSSGQTEGLNRWQEWPETVLRAAKAELGSCQCNWCTTVPFCKGTYTSWGQGKCPYSGTTQPSTWLVSLATSQSHPQDSMVGMDRNPAPEAQEQRLIPCQVPHLLQPESTSTKLPPKSTKAAAQQRRMWALLSHTAGAIPCRSTQK